MKRHMIAALLVAGLGMPFVVGCNGEDEKTKSEKKTTTTEKKTTTDDEGDKKTTTTKSTETDKEND